jgi:metallo-beta-lactamase family protein
VVNRQVRRLLSRGSCFLVEAHGCRFLIDCGMAQAAGEADEHNQQAFAFDAAGLDFVVLTHAHIDHSGLLPKLGLSRASRAHLCHAGHQGLLEVLLKDSAHIQMMDAERAGAARRGRASSASRRLLCIRWPMWRARWSRSRPGLMAALRTPSCGDGAFSGCRAYSGLGHCGAMAGRWPGGTRKLVASGDLGQPGRVILRDPTPIMEADLLLIESTYGDRQHKSTGDTLEELVDAVTRTAPMAMWSSRHLPWGARRSCSITFCS